MSTSVCDDVLIRIGGVPSTAAAGQRCGAAGRSVQALLELEERQLAVGGQLVEVLYELVPRFEGAVRRAALRMRREIHNRRALGPCGEVEEHLGSCRRDLDVWRDLFTELRQRISQGEDELGRESAAAGGALRGLVGEDGLDRGIALTSTALRRDLARGKGTGKAFSKVERAATRILLRAALKCSPLSFFTQLAVGRWGRKDEVEKLNIAQLPRALAFEILRAAVADPELGAALGSEPVPRLDGDALIATYAGGGRFFWRFDRTVDGRHLAEREETGGWEHSWRVATGLIRPVVPWSLSDEAPLERLSEHLLAQPVEKARRLGSQVRELVSAESDYAAAAGGERAQIVSEARGRIDDLFQDLSWPRPSWFNSDRLFYEDVRSSGAPALPDRLRADIAAVGDWVETRAVLHPLYNHIVTSFLTDYPGGQCHDVPAWLWSMSRRVPEAPAAAEAEWRPKTPFGVAVFTQVQAGDWRDLDGGDYALVLNLITPSFGGVLARHSRLFPEQGLPSRAAAWIRQCYPEGQVCGFSFAQEWHDLQSQGGAALPSLRWPTEPRSEVDVTVDASELSLVFDPQSGQLAFWHGGAPIHLVYTGTIPTRLLGASMRLLAILAHPWRCPPAREVASHRPRLVQGRLVLRRAEWCVSAAGWPRRKAFKSDFLYLCAAERWRRAHGLPEEVFVQAGSARELSARRRKPTWLRFDSLHSLASADGLITDELVHLRFTEALPAHDEHPGLGDSMPRAVELVSLLSCTPGGA